MQLANSGLWPFESLPRLDCRGLEASKDCLPCAGKSQGMMGNKDILECKLPQRGETLEDGGPFPFPTPMVV